MCLYCCGGVWLFSCYLRLVAVCCSVGGLLLRLFGGGFLADLLLAMVAYIVWCIWASLVVLGRCL